MPAIKISSIALFIALVLLFAVGVSLFFMREEKLPKTISHELTVSAKKSAQAIIDHQFLILINPKKRDRIDDILAPLGLEVKLPLLNWLLVQTKNANSFKAIPLASEDARESRQILSSLFEHPDVLDAQHNYVIDATQFSDEEDLQDDWQLPSPNDDEPYLMNVKKAWEITEGSSDVVIAVVDQFTSHGRFTFNDRFPSCADRVSLFAPNFGQLVDEENPLPHGEIMLQALGACNNDETLTTGVDKKASIIAADRFSFGAAQSFLVALLVSHVNVCEESVIACNDTFPTTFPNKKPDVLLLPFGGQAPELLQFTSDMTAKIRAQNVIVVASAGNNEANAQNFFPGGSPNILNVGALSRDGKRSSFSNFGPAVDLLAPGEDIEFRYPNGVKKINGTSISAAYVAATSSLLKAINKGLTQRKIEYLVVTSSHQLNCEEYCLSDRNSTNCETLCCENADDKICGKAALNVEHAVTLAKRGLFPDPILELSESYVLYLRDDSDEKTVDISNESDVSTLVRVNVFNQNVDVIPNEFLLGPSGTSDAQKTIAIRLRKEPFTRQTFTMEFVAVKENVVVDRMPFYLEYIPKR